MKTKNTFRNVLALSILCGPLFLLLACSAGSQGVQKTGYCKTKYDPLSLDKDGSYNDKLTLKPGEDFSPMPLEYDYSGMDFYFADDERSGFKIHLQQTKNSKTGELGKLEVVCVGGNAISPTMAPITQTFTFVSDLKVEESGLTKIKTRTVTFDLRPRGKGREWLETSIHVDTPDFIPGRPQDLPHNFQEAEQYFLSLKRNPENYQVLSRYKNTSQDRKTGRDNNVIVRTLVGMQTNHVETADEWEKAKHE